MTKTKIQKNDFHKGTNFRADAPDGLGGDIPLQKSLSKLDKTVYKAPYLLRNEPVGSFNHVWSMDISYIAMKEGFMYMIGIIDVYSRMLVGCRLSNTLDARESVETLEEAVRRYGVPDIVNTDQGRQYTGRLWHDSLQKHDIRQSMDGRGRCKDNIWIERFWRTLKRECVYLNPVGSVGEMRRCIAKAASKREQCQTCLSYAERERARRSQVHRLLQQQEASSGDRQSNPRRVVPEGKSRFSERNGSLLTLPSVRDLGRAKYLTTKIITGKVSRDSH